jgi:hypothetical protein
MANFNWQMKKEYTLPLWTMHGVGSEREGKNFFPFAFTLSIKYNTVKYCGEELIEVQCTLILETVGGLGLEGLTDIDPSRINRSPMHLTAYVFPKAKLNKDEVFEKAQTWASDFINANFKCTQTSK